MMMKTPEDIRSAYITALEKEDDGLWEQGQVIAAAVDAGFRRKDVLSQCAQLGGQSTRTARNRERTWRVFGAADSRAAHIRWSLHDLCCTGVDIDNPATYASAHKWLEIAEAGYTDEAGNWRPHTYATFKTRVIAAGADPDADKPLYLLDNAPCTFQRLFKLHLSDLYELVLNITPAVAERLDAAVYGHELFVTLVVQAPAQEAMAS